MTTAIARQTKQRHGLQELRKFAEQQLREMGRKMREVDALIEQLEAAAGEAPPRPSPLDQMHEVANATEALRTAGGNISAELVAKLYGVSLNQLAGWLGRSRQALSKTPDADSLQPALSYFERVARLRLALKSDVDFRKWLRTPQDLLDKASPLELMAKGERQVMADFVDDALTGASA
jgi:transcriptional regulator with XRE-family HTH domain